MNLLAATTLAIAISGASLAAIPADAPAKSSAAQIRFTYENPRLTPAKYSLAIDEEGSGRYDWQGAGETGELEPLQGTRDVHVSPATREELFSAARHAGYFAIACDAGGKHVAFQGTKTLEYQGPDGHGKCSYNWSKNKQIQLLTEQFEGIALTLEEGHKLETEYMHQPLDLDSELEILSDRVRDRQALEIQNIAPVLQKIAGDETMMQIVRQRAQAILTGAASR